MSSKFTNVSIPDGLADAVDDYIKDHPNMDFRSRAQVVEFALRLLLIDDKKKKVH